MDVPAKHLVAWHRFALDPENTPKTEKHAATISLRSLCRRQQTFRVERAIRRFFVLKINEDVALCR